MPAKQAPKPRRKPARTAARKTAAKKAARKSRVFTISLPPDLADRAEAIAREESRTMSELFREALRSYRLERTRKWMEGIAEYVRTLPPTGYTEEDVPRLIKEVRAEMRAEKGQKMRKAG
jgi:CopG family transcriptional regulator/antitoxin EndoAI